jgi:hypothetical protein
LLKPIQTGAASFLVRNLPTALGRLRQLSGAQEEVT